MAFVEAQPVKQRKHTAIHPNTVAAFLAALIRLLHHF
jgi:hypothetical protein